MATLRLALVTDAWHPQENGVVRVLDSVLRLLGADGIEVEVISPEQFTTIPCPTYPEIPLAVLPGDTFVLCSDGLCGLLGDSEIGMIAGELPPNEASRLLVHLANLRGGTDNITVIVVRAGEIPKGAGSSDPEIISRNSGLGWWGFAFICLLLGLRVWEVLQTRVR